MSLSIVLSQFSRFVPYSDLENKADVTKIIQTICHVFGQSFHTN